MKKNILYHSLLFLALLFACEQDVIDLQSPEEEEETEDCPDDASAGSANFTKFVAIGSSLTAGYQAGALFTDGQDNALPRIMAKQFECVGGSATFNQPDIGTDYGFNTVVSPNPTTTGVVLGRLLLQGTPVAPSPYIYTDAAAGLASIPNPSVNASFMYTGSDDAVSVSALNNFGVPGIVIGQALIAETGDWSDTDADAFNPFYARFASDPGTSTLLVDAYTSLANSGTFFLFWMGNNDVLAYAVSGGSDDDLLTDPTNFEYYFNTAITTLLSVSDVKGVVGNIPSVTSLPYFTVVPWNAVEFDASDATDVATVSTLNAAFSDFNDILDALVASSILSASNAAIRKVSYSTGTNPVLIVDEELTDLGDTFDYLLSQDAITEAQREALTLYEQSRPATSDDLVLLAAGSILGTLADDSDATSIYGVVVPLADQYILTSDEQSEVATYTDAFNESIAETVNASDRLALADVNATLTAFVTAGADIQNGVTITPSFVPPTGAFSEDGVHPNTRGIAYVANVFIAAINAQFGASVPYANIGDYDGTALPIP